MCFVSGNLKVKTNGQRTIYLNCSLGKFLVRDEALSVLADGTHHGIFEIQKITPGHDFINGRLFFEMIAVLKSFAFQQRPETETNFQQPELPIVLANAEMNTLEVKATSEAKAQESTNTIAAKESFEADVLASEISSASLEPSTSEKEDKEVGSDDLKEDVEAGVHSINQSSAVLIDSDVELFGGSPPLGETFEQDMSLDREVLIEQRRRLKALGYEFCMAGQHWNKINLK